MGEFGAEGKEMVNAAKPRSSQTARLSISLVVPITAAAISRIAPAGASSGSRVAASKSAKY
jgi:hypothetical protein